jgi:hypothetical protein
MRQNLRSGETEVVLDPCSPSGTTCNLLTDRRRGFTVYDRSSRRLYFVMRENGTTAVKPIYTSGAVHHAVIHDSRLRVLLHSPGESALLLLEEAAGEQSFTVTPVTLCEGTTAVHLGYRDGLPFFLFTERSIADEGAPRYVLAALSSSVTADGEVQYRKRELYSAERPAGALSVVPDGPRLWIFLVQDTLKLIIAEVGDL